MADPWLPYFGHPLLPAGFNSAPNDGDEVDGAGYNEPTWPVLLDSFEALVIVFITEEMLSVFKGCADLVIPCDDWVLRIRAEPRTVVVRKAA